MDKTGEIASWFKVIGGFTVCNEAELAQLLPKCALELSADIHAVDIRAALNVAQILDILSKRLKFPGYFGHNLDALHDMTGECADIAQGRLDVQANAVPHIWLIYSTSDQTKVYSSVQDAVRDAMIAFTGTALSIVWVVV